MDPTEEIQALKAKVSQLEGLGRYYAEIRARYEAMLKSIGEGLIVIGSHNKVVMVNRAAEEMLGWSVEEAVGRDLSEIAPLQFETNKDTLESVLSVLANVSKTSQTLTIIRKDRSSFPASVTTSSLAINGQIEGMAMVFRDITQEVEINRSKSDFVAIASHQLRTPLGSMKWNLQMLKAGDFGQLDGAASEVVGDVLEGTDRMIGLINDLLTVSRIDQNRVEDNPEELLMGEIVSSVVKEQSFFAQKRQINIENIVDNQVKIRADKKRLREVIANLVSNGIKYNREGKMLTISAIAKDGETILAVADEGIGIPKSDQSRVFSRFFRADNAMRSDTEGSGLGLYVVKSYMERWGGRAYFESEVGKGTIFYLAFPKI
jgi:PAS domain S-box-containing protein